MRDRQGSVVTSDGSSHSGMDEGENDVDHPEEELDQGLEPHAVDLDADMEDLDREGDVEDFGSYDEGMGDEAGDDEDSEDALLVSPYRISTCF
jgi:hypothetical protein